MHLLWWHMHPDIPYLREIIVFLVTAGVIVPIIARLRISPVLGFLLTGLLIGPFGLGHITNTFPALSAFVIDDVAGARALAELGVVFLMFMIGLELSYERLWMMRRAVFGMGSMQVVLSALAIGTVASLYNHGFVASIIIGLCLALSSTAMVMQLLAEKKRLGSRVGRKAFAVLLFQDLAVVPILFVVGFLGKAAAAQSTLLESTLYLGKAMGFAALTVAVILILGRLVLRPFLHLVGASRSRELSLATTLLIIIGLAAGTAMAGLSMALGAFLAGLLLAETEYRHQIEVDIAPFKGLLLGLFFLSVGMGIDIAQVLQNPLPLVAGVLGLYAIKGLIMYAIARLSGLPQGKSIELGCLLGQGGEFAFIVLGMALTMNLIPDATGQYMLLVASLSMMMTPFVAQLGNRIKTRLDGEDGSASIILSTLPADIEHHVVLVGYGRVGQGIGALLQDQNIPFIAIDQAVEVAKIGDVNAPPMVIGDPTDPALLASVHMEDALAVVITISDPDAAASMLTHIRATWPNLPVLVRAYDTDHARTLMQLGASTVIPEIRESAYQLGTALLARLGVPEDSVRLRIEQHRAADEAAMHKAN